MKKYLNYIVLFLLVISCTKSADKLKLSTEFIELSTTVKIIFYDISPEDKRKAEIILNKADDIFKYFNKTMNPSYKNSILYNLNRSERGKFVEIPKSLRKILKESQAISVKTDSTFDIGIFPLVKESGFLDTGKPHLLSLEKRNYLIKNSTMKNLVFKRDSIKYKTKEVLIGLGAIAKGYAVDSVATFFKENGFNEFIINAGGDISVCSKKDKIIGIRNPRKANNSIDTLKVSGDISVVTSGDYEKFFIDSISHRRYCHIIDPKIGASNSDCLSITIIHSKTYLADAFATAIFVMGSKKGEGFMLKNNLSGIIIYKDKNDKIINRKINFDQYKY